MTQLFSNELQRLSQRTEGAFAEDDQGSTTPGGPPLMTTILRLVFCGAALPPVATWGGHFANDDAAALEHPKERPRVVVANPARNAVYVGTTGDVGLTVIPL